MRPNQPPPPRPPMPPPMPYGPSGGAPRPPRKRGGGGVLALLLAVIVLVTGGLVLVAVRTGDDSRPAAAEESPGSTEAATNPLLTDEDATLLPAKCGYTAWSAEVDTARTFFETAASCLEDAWKPLLAKENLPFEAPTLNVSASTEGITTPCTGTTSSFAAFYCPANKTIYMPISQLQTEIFKNNWVVYLSVFAHEYGHHIQAMSGILRRANAERVDAGVRSTRGLELSRRVELQAQCFNGMYLGSANKGGALSTAQMNVAKRDANGRGDGPTDARDHGTAENSGNWFEIGVDKNRTFHCNTFTAPAGAVN
ncbi:neutral zinc metallopeptidase [Nocardia goodfellowii]|uniref:Metalloprotease n=1 Tax=Nocardia goodfellowii TaxID=882446 RepID=A0ABS4Q8G8_9NOCA|nr:neutral zinc metallopeptidase [Nocardia goodfellowii]MBP2187987.1 putative metalloprotease [Nocardia goodfellowii]